LYCFHTDFLFDELALFVCHVAFSTLLSMMIRGVTSSAGSNQPFFVPKDALSSTDAIALFILHNSKSTLERIVPWTGSCEAEECAIVSL
jgi:hypothetical protein